MSLTLHREAPCATCPYRKDAPRGLWDASEFLNLLRQDANELGGNVFACHADRRKADGKRGFCVGWLLDQRRRGLPSIQLRLALVFAPEVAERFGKLRDDAGRYFKSIAAMCRANGVHAESGSRRKTS